MRKAFLIVFFAVAWLMSSIVFGGIFFTVKDTIGWDVFSSTGYHAFETCLIRESTRALREKGPLSPQ